MSPPAPRRVLMTADTIGGVWTFAMELCAALGARGVETTLVTMGRLPDRDQQAEAAAIPNLSLAATEYRLEWMDDCERDVIASGEFLLDVASRIKPDLIHANTYYHAALPFDAPVLMTAHSCVASWWRACKDSALPPEREAYAGWIGDAVGRADMLVAPTRAFLEQFQRLHGCARASRTIWNGRSVAPEKIPEKEAFVLVAGRLWDEAKNIAVLCRAAQGHDLQIRLAGEDLSPDGRGVGFANVTFLGRIEPAALLALMARAAIFAAPARYEPFGLSILEAASSGCALVLGDIPTLRELWDGVATFVHPDDAAGWRRALQQLLDEPERAARAGMRARAHAARYSAERMANAYCEAYGAVLSQPGHSQPAGIAA